ncbi:FAD-dependent oxidoreductase [Streptomyces sp. NBC_00005]|uniref:FAD-dependent oxidoreductase n=1 Tax=Streptomyces sp. NBC_00005 TaxID=2903609 RepID=UPI00386C24E4
MERVDVAVIGGGQSGLAAAHALRRQRLEPVVLEASARPAGSWSRYYDSLTLSLPPDTARCRGCLSAGTRIATRTGTR